MPGRDIGWASHKNLNLTRGTTPLRRSSTEGALDAIIVGSRLQLVSSKLLEFAPFPGAAQEGFSQSLKPARSQPRLRLSRGSV